MLEEFAGVGYIAAIVSRLIGLTIRERPLSAGSGIHRGRQRKPVQATSRATSRRGPM
jgi:hypothetical protein